MKKAFSLAEVLVTLTIIGIIAGVTIPIVSQSFQSNDKLLYKKAEQTVEKVIEYIMADDTLSPDGKLDNTFCNKFVSQINTNGDVNCNSSSVPGSPNLITTNGMRWYGLEDVGTSTFTSAKCDTVPGLTGGLSNCMKIEVDINGVGKQPNSNDYDTPNTDILKVYVTDIGKVGTPPGIESTYLSE